MKKERREFYNHKEEITKIITDAVVGENTDRDILTEKLGTSDYYAEFLANLSSQELAQENSDFLNATFEQKRDTDKLLKKLISCQRRHIIKLTGSIIGVAAVLMFSLIIYNYHNEERNIPLTAEISTINTPTLIVSDSTVVELPMVKMTKLVATDFSTESTDSTTSRINRLIIPKGFTYSIILEDGTEVMLNSNSQLLYPSRFSEEKREVTLEGEGFFNVKKGGRPFIVNVDNNYIIVHGTQFNINNRIPGVIKTILLEGSVGVGGENFKEVTLISNQMSTLNNHTHQSSIEEVNAEEMLGWRDGYFKYINIDFETVIRDIMLWYNIEIEYNIPDFKTCEITISISRDMELTNLMKVIENVANVKFIKIGGEKYAVKIDNKK